MATNGTLAGTPSTTGTPFSGHSSNGMTTQKYETKPNVPYQHLIRPPIIHSPLNLSKVNPKPKIQLLDSRIRVTNPAQKFQWPNHLKLKYMSLNSDRTTENQLADH